MRFAFSVFSAVRFQLRFDVRLGLFGQLRLLERLPVLPAGRSVAAFRSARAFSSGFRCSYSTVGFAFSVSFASSTRLRAARRRRRCISAHRGRLGPARAAVQVAEPDRGWRRRRTQGPPLRIRTTGWGGPRATVTGNWRRRAWATVDVTKSGLEAAA